MSYDYVNKKNAEVKKIPPRIASVSRFILKCYTRMNIWVFKISRGKLWNRFPVNNHPICVLTTKGAKSGKKREVALLHLPFGEQELLVASQGGMDKMPLWYFNVQQNPDIEILVGGRSRRMRAERVSDDKKRELWPHLVDLYPDFDTYQARTERNIPVFLCTER